MTCIIKNIYTCNPSQSIFTRFLGKVVLAFILLIGGSGSAWAFENFSISFIKPWAAENINSGGAASSYYVTASTDEGIPTLSSSEPESYIAYFEGYYHSNTYGLYYNAKIKVPVKAGKYEIGLGMSDYGGDIAISDGTNVLKTINSVGGKYAVDAANVATDVVIVPSDCVLEIYASSNATNVYFPYISVVEIEDPTPVIPSYPITAIWDFTNSTSDCSVAGNNQTSYPSDQAGISLTMSYSGSGEFKPRPSNGDVQVNATTEIRIPVVSENDVITITNFQGDGGQYNAIYTLGGEAGINVQTKTYSPTAAEVSAGEVVLTVTGSGYMKKIQVVQEEPAPVIPEKISSFELDFTGTGNAYDIVKDKSTTGSASVFGISIDENGNPVETSTNPHISFNTYYKDSTYGLWFANTGQSMSFDVYGPVKITLGMTDYNSDIVITDSENTELTTISLNDNNAKFTSSTGEPVVSYNYTGGATRLTLKCKQNQIYIPYIKVEEIDVPIVDEGIPVPSGLYEFINI